MYIVGLGGTLRPASSTERVITHVLGYARELGAETASFVAEAIDLPMYSPTSAIRSAGAHALIEAVRRADCLIIGSPGYHGGVSGLVKNALDYAEDLAKDRRPYLEGRAVGCISTGAGWQGANSALHSLRSIVHALRGWPSPLGIAVNTRTPAFGNGGECLVPELQSQMQIMAAQLVQFGSWQSAASNSAKSVADGR